MKKCLLAISIATIVRETNSFVKIMQLIRPNYPWENGDKQIKITGEKLSQSCILCSITKDKDRSSRVKMHQFSFKFLPPIIYTCWVDMIYLTCLVFIKSPWWPVWIFCAYILCSYQKLSKIFHGLSVYA